MRGDPDRHLAKDLPVVPQREIRLSAQPKRASPSIVSWCLYRRCIILLLLCVCVCVSRGGISSSVSRCDHNRTHRAVTSFQIVLGRKKRKNLLDVVIYYVTIWHIFMHHSQMEGGSPLALVGQIHSSDKSPSGLEESATKTGLTMLEQHIYNY